MENIRRKSMRQTALLIELAEPEGYKVNSPRDPERRGGTVTLEPDPACSYEVSRELTRPRYHHRLPRTGRDSHLAALLQQR